MGDPFGARLEAALHARGPLCVGIDPHPALLARWGLPDDPSGLRAFVDGALEAVGDVVAVVKPQSAFFEAHGAAGVAVLEHAVAAAREAGALCLVDAKRGDIGSTMAAYARAYTDPTSPLAADAVTASAYLGYESLRPLVDAAAAHDRGVFVLALTSNPQGAEVQQAAVAGGTVAGRIVGGATRDNAGRRPFGHVGVVVGATRAGIPADVDLAAMNGPVLAPGLGAQGARPADLARLFASVRDRVLPATSRGVLEHGPDRSSLRAAAETVRDGCAAALHPAGPAG